MATNKEQTIFDTVTEANTVTEAKKEIVIIDLVSKKDEILINPKVLEALEKGQGYTIRAKNLVKSFPGIASLEDLPIYRAITSKSGLSVVLMPSIFKTEDGLKVCIPDTNASLTSLLKVDSIFLSLEDESYCILTDGKECFLKCNLSIDKTALKRYAIADKLTLGDYTLETLPEDLATVFRDRPKLELPLDNLEILKPYTIIGENGKSKKFDTPLISVKDEQGNILENLITNANLEKNGSIGRSFKIIKIESYTKKVKTDKGKEKEEKQKKYFIQWLDEQPLIITED